MIKRNHLGSALVLVLWLVIVMTMVATVTARISRLDGRVSQLSVERIRCRWSARAGLETGVALLMLDDTPTDALTDLWADSPEELKDIPVEGGTFTARVIDESGKLNLNQVTENQLAMLENVTEEIIDSLQDWRDSDQDMRPYGAEEGYYVNQPYGYSCRDGEFQTVRELLLIRGMDESLLYGNSSVHDTGSAPWIDLMTCYSAQSNTDAEGNRKININTANRNSLRNDLSLNDDQITWIENHRQFRNYSELMDSSKQATNNNNNQNNNRPSSSNGTSSSSTQSSGRNNSSNTNSGGQNRQSGNNSGRNNRNGPGSQNNQNTNNRSGSGNNTGNDNGSGQNGGDQGTPLDLSAVLRIANRICFDDQPYTYGRVNVNTAPFEVLEALFSGRRDIAQSIVTSRASKEGGFASFEELRQVSSMTQDVLRSALDSVTLQSGVFQIQSTGTSDATGQTVRIEAVLNRDEQNGRVLYWRED